MIRCAICGRVARVSTIRQRWIDGGGFGPVPDAAIVHPACDRHDAIAAALRERTS
jgi:hypothetical protein